MRLRWVFLRKRHSWSVTPSLTLTQSGAPQPRHLQPRLRIPEELLGGSHPKIYSLCRSHARDRMVRLALTDRVYFVEAYLRVVLCPALSCQSPKASIGPAATAGPAWGRTYASSRSSRCTPSKSPAKNCWQALAQAWPRRSNITLQLPPRCLGNVANAACQACHQGQPLDKRAGMNQANPSRLDAGLRLSQKQWTVLWEM